MKSVNSLSYSRSDRRSEGVNMSRLDRFYLSSYFQDSGGLVVLSLA